MLVMIKLNFAKFIAELYSMPTPYPEIDIKVPRFEEALGFYTTKQRSSTMAKIRNKNTKPEMAFRKALWKSGVRFRVHVKGLPGRPDISNRSKKFVVFIDGEFWHGHDWRNKKNSIKSNRKFWIPKIERNMQRDRQVNAELNQMGFQVFRFWQKDVEENLGTCLMQILRFMSQE
jgi:DNA mismatch endonuclease (patch repair protein)